MKMKTIDEVLDDMKNNAIEYLNGGNVSHNAYELLMSFHGDINRAIKALEADRDNWRRQALDEDARANATCKESRQVGSVAKMRAALLKSRKAMDEMSKSIFQGWIEDGLVDVMGEAQKAISSALSVPPRNCDLFANAQDALAAIHNDREYVNNPIDERRLTVGWLFAEAKGGAE